MKIKICGIKYKDNLDDIITVHPDLMGFIFYVGSQRYVGNNLTAADLATVPPTIVKTGVFVNEDVQRVVDIVKEYGLQAVQLHGDESPSDVSRISNSLNNVESNEVLVIKAFGIDDAFDWLILKDYQDCCDLFLFDTKTSNYGGSGRQFNHTLLENYDLDTPIMLSGGIGIGDLDRVLDLELDMIEVIDMNSKLESEPGRKDSKLVQEAINRIETFNNRSL